jgi:hypothetical protein
MDNSQDEYKKVLLERDNIITKQGEQMTKLVNIIEIYEKENNVLKDKISSSQSNNKNEINNVDNKINKINEIKNIAANQLILFMLLAILILILTYLRNN